MSCSKVLSFDESIARSKDDGSLNRSQAPRRDLCQQSQATSNRLSALGVYILARGLSADVEPSRYFIQSRFSALGGTAVIASILARMPL